MLGSGGVGGALSDYVSKVHDKDGGEAAEDRRRSSASLDPSNESRWLQYSQDQDETDHIPESLRFNWFDVFCIIFSILTYILDLGMDIYVACVYYESKHIYYFILTLIFVIIPSVCMAAFSLRWYVIDMDNQAIPKPSCSTWIVRIIFLLLQIAPVLRYLDALMYGLKSRRAAKRNDKHSQYKYYTCMVIEDADSTLIRLFEAFMESAPQVTLQLFILIYHYNDVGGPFANSSFVLQVLAILSSLVSLAWSLAAYHRSLRFAQEKKTNISYKGTLLQFCWHMCSISARVFALSVFASTYPILIVPVCMCHFCIMLFWLLLQKSKTCETNCEEALFNVVVAFIYIFTFFNVRDEATRYKYVTFYMITLCENTLLLFAWFFSVNSGSPDIFMFRVSGIVGDFSLFFLGILCMVLYYVYFHPTMGTHSPKKTYSTPNPSISFPFDAKTKALARKASLDASQIHQCPPKKEQKFQTSTDYTQITSTSVSANRPSAENHQEHNSNSPIVQVENYSNGQRDETRL